MSFGVEVRFIGVVIWRFGEFVWGIVGNIEESNYVGRWVASGSVVNVVGSFFVLIMVVLINCVIVVFILLSFN